ncbi:hypothetical protein C0J52_17898 [Blattella germanica]|nr:hypothetical protein C0J52_17898 [Blattella germanica]
MDLGHWKYTQPRGKTEVSFTSRLTSYSVIAIIRNDRLRWAGHLIRMEDSRPAKRMLLNNPGGQRYRGRPRARREDDVEEDARTIVVPYSIGLPEQITENIDENSSGQPGPSCCC